MNIREILNQRFAQAMLAAGIPADCAPHVAPSKNPQFGDYQANGAMGAAKAMGRKPRDIAQEILDQVTLDDMADKTEIAGPGFINVHLRPEWMAEQLKQQDSKARHNDDAQTIVVDYSSPNLAKEMHVGHLRSTIIGDSLARVLEFMGHSVIRQNHVGDWGTQFGMLTAELEEQLGQNQAASMALKDLEQFYQQAKKHFDDDPAFADKARDYVVKLQSGDAKLLELWEKFRDVSLEHGEELYQALGVTLKRDDVKGESFYNDDLANVVSELKAQGLAVEDDGAIVVFLQELADKEGNPSVVIIQKKGGGYLYATTDLAAMRHRVGELKADRIMYFIDARQSLHMKQVFTLGRKAGFVSDDVSLEHHAFGTMMGEDGTPFKTRSGGTVKLADLTTEAVERATALVESKNPDLNESERAEIGRKVGIGAVKYADLSKTRTNDYIFSWESMLSFEGNTAPYLQYAYARIQSIFRRAEVSADDINAELQLNAPEEQALALKLLRFEEAIEQVAKEAYPHILCTYLYEAASLYMKFYEACPILKDGVSEADKMSRLQLCAATASILRTGLDLLGIETMEKM
ncbi:arginine--tRNA ligase [Pseudoteredinibacter isoporae]|uniref:Arginine--tRNA ligase n=1 Tax=Pseudoteredinibacter isoporae TaxID=570281 RepID=A0A7X0MV68_9GAMM|nr:arginine--tRNA ligase [Pseudoteredinibacter isoporae]MBB6520770.1 arginyl-tRNA synthetase [Pseudoteredinibacter isoporae]NHO86336.1 arginine--tRNA ligase [Pseudoteredinibacter isoporae]NIB25212.1 arginine--tRNA ligase [Pseudoteredinibacter isoporae]